MPRPPDVAKVVLLGVLAAGTLALVLSSPAGVRRLSRAIGYELKRAEARRRFLWTIAYLRRKRYLDYREAKDGAITITLTEDGRRRALHYKFGALSLPRPEHWDGKWRMIAFDIPERKRKGRDALRHKLRELGLVQLQKSLWVWPHECRDEIDFVAEIFDISPYVHYIVAESITSEKFLTYKFNLA